MYTLQYAIEQCGEGVAPEFLVQIEFQILFLLGLKTKLVTPFCFFNTIEELFPQQDMGELELSTIMDLILTCTEAKDYSAEEMLFAALISCFQIKGVSPISYEVIKAITNKWKKSLVLAEILCKKILG